MELIKVRILPLKVTNTWNKQVWCGAKSTFKYENTFPEAVDILLWNIKVIGHFIC